jgi:hypothetical protein
LDRLLPGGGFRRGTLVEWLAAGQGTGATTLALAAARQACRDGGALVVLDACREFYPLAAVRLGIALDRLIVVQAVTPADQHWALDQALRCPGVAAVLAWPAKLEGLLFRRLQLAAEIGGGLGLLIRPESARQEPSWAEVRLEVEPLPGSLSADSGLSADCRRRWRIHVLRCRGGNGDRSVEVEVDDETRAVHLAAELAHPTAGRRASGA